MVKETQTIRRLTTIAIFLLFLLRNCLVQTDIKQFLYFWRLWIHFTEFLKVAAWRQFLSESCN